MNDRVNGLNFRDDGLHFCAHRFEVSKLNWRTQSGKGLAREVGGERSNGGTASCEFWTCISRSGISRTRTFTNWLM